MTIREAATDDAEAITAIARESWSHDYPDILSRDTAEQGVEEWYAPETIRTEIDSDDAVVPVAEHDGEMVGFAHAVADETGGTVLRVYVAPDHRGDGIGSDLLDHARQRLVDRGAGRLRAMVLAENEPGNEFYRRLGFELRERNETRIGGEIYRENVYLDV
ncbi:GNAT family N-acetyltransferase [Halococcus dombrowskii]|uniref:GNAT family N-acetyltransferase n=1 Tax=Halococcus dombrowskii TaxID=179637 RepID=A0AAV3SHT8_HALDO|nr:GNAT family N-acetyltransferase [Halococcus dombrowskii]UOO94175.1 GNAT family N-acetyltransferase [Halococcus dombrowskii]